MPESTKDDERPWPFWLLEACLPHEEDVETEQPMSNRQFYVGLLVALAIVIAAGMLIRGCSI
ncbi:MAG: hypothetical protein ABSE41_09920 [Bacteroidota bacterium]|jgi:hypothetical protein